MRRSFDASEWRGALDLFEANAALAVRKDARDFGQAIIKCHWEIASTLLREMEAHDVQQNVIIFGSLVNVYKEVSMWPCSLQALQRSLDVGLQGSVISINAALSACGRAVAWQSALEMLVNMSSHCDVVSYNAAIAACTKGMQTDLVLHLMMEMQDFIVKPDQVTFASAIVACKLAAAWQSALSLLQEMMAAGCLPDPISYGAVMATCTVKWERSLTLLQTLCSSDQSPDLVHCNSGIAAWSQGKLWHVGLCLLKRTAASQMRLDVISLNSALTACERADEWQLAAAMLRSLRGGFLQPDATSSAICTAAFGAGPGSARWSLALTSLLRARQQGLTNREGISSAMVALTGFSVASEATETNGLRWTLALLLLKQAAIGNLQPDSLMLSLP